MSHAPRRGRTWKLPAHPRRTARLGSYQLLAELGRGGTGVVYRARRVGEEQDVALKVLRRPTPEEAARFRKEAQLVSGLDHPGIVQLVAHGRVREEWFLAFELIEGGSLLDRLCRGPLSPSHAARLIAEVADVIEAAHEAGVVHRDIKPANVLLDAQGAVKVADFGLARELGDATRMTQTGDILGTPAYMAPEQAMGKVEADGTLIDVYGLGATLYHLIAGDPPFQSGMAGMIELVHQAPEPLGQRAKVDPALARIVHRCLAKEPSQRFPSAAALRDALDDYLAGRTQPAPVRLRLWPSAAAGIAAALLGCLGLPLFLSGEEPVRSGRTQSPLSEQAQRHEPSEPSASPDREPAPLRGRTPDPRPKWEGAAAPPPLEHDPPRREERATRGDRARFARAQRAAWGEGQRSARSGAPASQPRRPRRRSVRGSIPAAIDFGRKLPLTKDELPPEERSEVAALSSGVVAPALGDTVRELSEEVLGELEADAPDPRAVWSCYYQASSAPGAYVSLLERGSRGALLVAHGASLARVEAGQAPTLATFTAPVEAALQRGRDLYVATAAGRVLRRCEGSGDFEVDLVAKGPVRLAELGAELFAFSADGRVYRRERRGWRPERSLTSAPAPVAGWGRRLWAGFPSDGGVSRAELRACDPSDGRWTSVGVLPARPRSGGVQRVTALASEGEVLFVGTATFDARGEVAGGHLLARGPAGALELLTSFSGDAPRSLAHFQDTLYVGTERGRVHYLVARDGRVALWELPEVPPNGGVTSLRASGAALLIGIRGVLGAEVWRWGPPQR